MQAIDVARDVTGADDVNALGFCIGGTLLACATAVMKANAEEKVASMTLLTAMLDFAEPGEIGALIDEQSVAAREAAIGEGGIMEGKELALTFSSLRANDLIWPYVVNSYLKGKKPPAFDLLYWNSRRHQPAGSDVLLVRAQHLSREQPARAGQDDPVRRARRPVRHRRAGVHLLRRARTTSCRGARPTRRSTCSPATTRSCSARAATSPA